MPGVGGAKPLDAASTRAMDRPRRTWWWATAHRFWPVRPGSMGRAIPGHEVVIQDEDGNRLFGEEGRDLRARSRPGDDARLLEPPGGHCR